MANMTTSVVKRLIDSVRALLEKSKSQIALSLPKHLNADRMVRITMTAIQTNPKLLECDPRTLIGAVIQASQLGLEPDGILGHAYLVPFRNKNNGNRLEVQLIPGYKGLLDLARRSGQVNRISAHIVYENEPFEMEYGTSEILKHKPLPPSQRGPRKGAYAVAVLKDGSTHFEWLWEEDVQKIKNSVKASYGPWVTHEEEMIRKTAIRRLIKYLPLSIELARASELEDKADANMGVPDIFNEDNFIPQNENSTYENFESTYAEEIQPEPEAFIEQPKTAVNIVEAEKNTLVEETKVMPQTKQEVAEKGWYWCENEYCKNPVFELEISDKNQECSICKGYKIHLSSDRKRKTAADERLRFLQDKGSVGVNEKAVETEEPPKRKLLWYWCDNKDCEIKACYYDEGKDICPICKKKSLHAAMNNAEFGAMEERKAYFKRKENLSKISNVIKSKFGLNNQDAVREKLSFVLGRKITSANDLKDIEIENLLGEVVNVLEDPSLSVDNNMILEEASQTIKAKREANPDEWQ